MNQQTINKVPLTENSKNFNVYVPNLVIFVSLCYEISQEVKLFMKKLKIIIKKVLLIVKWNREHTCVQR